MVMNESRQQAIQLTRSFCEAVNICEKTSTDFYKMLWIAHWAIENYGWEKTRQAVEDIMVAPNFKPDKAPLLLRDKLLVRKVNDDCMEEWFKKAMSA